MEEDTRQTDIAALVRHVPDLVMVLDEAGTVRRAGPAVERLLGYEPAALTDRQLDAFLHPDDRDHALAALAEPAAPDDAAATVRLEDPDGSWVQLTLVQSTGTGPGLGGYLTADRSDSDRDGRAALIAEMTEGFCAVDTDGTVTFVNDRAVELLGMGRGALIGADFANGLQIVSQVAEAHGWTVTVTESDEGGARFEGRGVRNS